VAIEQYHHLRRAHVTVTTYEVRQFPRWTTEVVYEAASHHRFSHEAYVILEWPSEEKFSLTDPTYRLDQIVRECRRFGVGLSTLEPYRNSYRLYPRLEATPRIPDDGDVEEWLDYVFSRNTGALKAFDDRMHTVQRQLASRRED
jgi:hypothetical protein